MSLWFQVAVLAWTFFSVQLPAFEVASIKPNTLGPKVAAALTVNPNGVNFSNVTTLDCVTAAYDVKDYQVEGPDWIRNDRFDVAARAPSATPDSQMKLMLQNLLSERFKLAVHRETKDLAVFAIVTAKNVKLRPTEGGPPNSIRFDGMKLVFRNYTVGSLAQFLSRLPVLDRPIVDQTGLASSYDFDITMDTPSGDPAAVKRAMLEWPSLMTDLPEQLGLRIEARKAPTSILIIDHVEKPTVN